MKNTDSVRGNSVDSKDLQIEILERRLQEISKKYEILSKATNDAVWDWDMQTESVEWNHGLTTIYGHKESNMGLQEWIAHLHPQDREEVVNGLHASIREGKLNWSAIYRYRCSNATYKYTYDRAYIVYEEGAPRRVIGAMQDIDERMQTLQEIEKLSLVASRTENLVIITDASERIEWVNEGFVRSTGYSLQEVVGKTPRFLEGPETNREVLDRIRQCIDRGESFTEEVLKYTRSGAKLWVKMNMNPVYNEYNRLHKFVSVETDVTVQKEYESRIVATALELANLIENANAVIIGVDQHGLVNEWNKQATLATGYTKQGLLGKKLTEFVIGATRQSIVDKYICHVVSGNSIDLTEFEIINRDGDRNILLLSATPRRNTDGQIVGLIAVGQDITELTEYRFSLEKKVRERTVELNRLLEKEKELTALKSQFSSIVSHEFKTPLSAIKGSVNHIRNHKLVMSPEELDAKVDVVLKQVEHMSHLLEDVLTLGKTEGNPIQSVKRPVRVVEFFETLKEEVEQMNNGTHTIVVKFDVLEPVLYSDPHLLRNIFINLLNNAIKFSPGKALVDLNVSQDTKGWYMNVRDKGIGIPEEEVVKIFDPFFRASNTDVIPGTGLGLLIVRKAVDLLGGTIRVVSTPGEGSVFSVTIPATR